MSPPNDRRRLPPARVPPLPAAPPPRPIIPRPAIEVGLPIPPSSRSVPIAGYPQAHRRERPTNPGIGDDPSLVDTLKEAWGGDPASDSALRATHTLADRLSQKVREVTDRDAVIAALAAELESQKMKPTHVESEPPPKRGLRLDVGDPVGMIKALGALCVVVGLGYGGAEIQSRVEGKAPSPAAAVAPVVAAASELESRVARLEACLAAREAADQEDEDFLERAFELVGAELPRRPNSGNPRRIEVAADPLVNPKPGARQKYRILSQRPARPDCK